MKDRSWWCLFRVFLVDIDVICVCCIDYGLNLMSLFFFFVVSLGIFFEIFRVILVVDGNYDFGIGVKWSMGFVDCGEERLCFWGLVDIEDIRFYEG